MTRLCVTSPAKKTFPDPHLNFAEIYYDRRAATVNKASPACCLPRMSTAAFCRELTWKTCWAAPASQGSS